MWYTVDNFANKKRSVLRFAKELNRTVLKCSSRNNFCSSDNTKTQLKMCLFLKIGNLKLKLFWILRIVMGFLSLRTGLVSEKDS